MLLRGGKLGDALLRQRNQRVQFGNAERRAFRRALDFNDVFRIEHHNVHIAVAARIFGVIQIQQRHAVYHACGNGGHAAD